MLVDNSSVAQDDVVASHFDLVLEADFALKVGKGDVGEAQRERGAADYWLSTVFFSCAFFSRASAAVPAGTPWQRHAHCHCCQGRCNACGERGSEQETGLVTLLLAHGSALHFLTGVSTAPVRAYDCVYTHTHTHGLCAAL